MRYRITIVALFLFILVQNNTEAQELANKNLALVDSIPLFTPTKYFNYFFADKYQSDSLLVSNYPQLSLSVLSTKGKYLGQITQKGDGPGYLETSTFIDVRADNNGDIFVLRQDNSYTLYLFNSKGGYKGKVNLFPHLPEYFVPVYFSTFEVITNKSGNEFRLIMSLGSTIDNPYSEKFYEKNKGIGEFIIDADSLKVKNVKTHLPYNEDQELSDFIRSGKISWYTPYPFFDYHNDMFYTISNYSKFLKIYDDDFNLLKSLEIKSLPKLRNNYEMSLNEKFSKLEFSERDKRQQKLNYENVNPWNIQVNGNLALIQMNEPKEKGRHRVLSIQEQQRGEYTAPNKFIVIKNLSTNEEKSFKLDKKYQGRIQLIDNNEILIQGYPDPNVEEIYLYRFKLSGNE